VGGLLVAVVRWGRAFVVLVVFVRCRVDGFAAHVVGRRLLRRKSDDREREYVDPIPAHEIDLHGREADESCGRRS
jgi:hypothetical protein